MDRWAFQRDPTLCTLTTRVVSCEPTEKGLHAVVLADTVLFAESGGQPSDRGWIDGREVLALAKREDGVIVHGLAAPISGEVTVTLDWARRFDLMQQHTAQHLLTATALNELGWPTTAFHLGEQRSDIELDVPELPAGKLEELCERVNALVRAAHPISCRWVQSVDEIARAGVRSRRLPAGLTGPIRLVEIAGVDLNTCGGTHLTSTAQIQAVALAGTERLRGGTRLHFLAGDRALGALRAGLERERAFNELLSCGPEDHLKVVAKLQAEASSVRRRCDKLLRELADGLGEQLAREPAPAALHRLDGDMAFLQAVARSYQRRCPAGWALLTAGETQGVFVLVGPAAELQAKGRAVAEILSGRGGGGAGLYQGKASQLARREQARALLPRLG